MRVSEKVIRMLDQADRLIRQEITNSEGTVGGSFTQEKLVEAREHIQKALTALILLIRKPG